MASIIAFCDCYSKLNDKQIIGKSLFGKLNWPLQLMDSENYLIVSFWQQKVTNLQKKYFNANKMASKHEKNLYFKI